MPKPRSEVLRQQVETLGLGKIERHIFLCADQTKPKCCSREVSAESWAYLKERVRELGLMEGERVVFRSKVDCLRVCTDGPTAVVWPDGIWYRNATPEVLERILQEHILGGVPVAEYVIARNAHQARTRRDPEDPEALAS